MIPFPDKRYNIIYAAIVAMIICVIGISIGVSLGIAFVFLILTLPPIVIVGIIIIAGFCLLVYALYWEISQYEGDKR